MMSVEIKVNARMIGYLYLHNQGPLFSNDEGTDGGFGYYYEYHRVDGAGINPNTTIIFKGNIEHTRSDGAELLVSNILKEVHNKCN